MATIANKPQQGCNPMKVTERKENSRRALYGAGDRADHGDHGLLD